ncbi:MAG: HU family DNA-binding protein [Balneolaceae bacterium]|nr:HU family DNA-binding protein [Balneolaceae bacterium]
MSEKVTYNEIAEALALKVDTTKQKSDEFIKQLIELVKEDLKENGSSSITKFGSFSVKEVAEREGVNPQTGDPIIIPAHKRLTFSAYKALKERVNEPYAHFEPRIIEEGTDAETTENTGVNNQKEFQETETTAEDKTVPEEEKQVSKASVPATPSRRPAPRTDKSSQAGLVYLVILLVLIGGVAAGWFFKDSLFPNRSNTTAETHSPATEQPVQEDDREPVETESDTKQSAAASSSAASSQQASAGVSSAGADVEELPAEGATYQAVYRPASSEWYWDIAEKMYGQPEFWPLVFAENKTLEDDPDIVFAWRALHIPELENTESPTSEDYKRLAEASRKVAKAYSYHQKSDKADEYNRFAKRYEAIANQ